MEKKYLQYEGGCVNCGKRRAPEGQNPFDISTQVSMKRADGNKTVVGMCESCYALAEFDYDLIRDNLAESEIAYAKQIGDRAVVEFAEGFKNLKFVGHEKGN